MKGRVKMTSKQAKKEFREFEKHAIESGMPAKSYLRRARVYIEIIRDLERSEKLSKPERRV